MLADLLQRPADAPLIWRHNAPAVTVGEFIARAEQFAARLPEALFAINLATDRLDFLTALVAADLRGQQTLLSSAMTPAAIADLQQRYTPSYVLDPESFAAIAALLATAHPPAASEDAERTLAVAFTSGSTGTPMPHPKSWRALATVARALSQRLGSQWPGQINIIATAPAQHMYVLETAVMMTLAAGATTHAEKPLYPADVRRVLVDMPEPRMLVTTPTHLKFLLQSQVILPPIALILSATAPLSNALAQTVERQWGTPVFEIYGCTEAGSVGTRRTVDGDNWQLTTPSELHYTHEHTVLHAAHLPAPVPLPDNIQILSPPYFCLGERHGDLVKVAGKRASLADLTRRLVSIPGVSDGVVFLADPQSTHEARLAALFVGDVPEKQILTALESQIDPVFLPRPLRRLPALPRNALGKILRADLLKYLQP